MIAVRVIVAGGRDFDDYELLADRLDFYLQRHLPDVAIVSGCARGADTLAERYAKERGLRFIPVPAHWKKDDNGGFDKTAGMRRNEIMAEFIGTHLVAFWDGKSKGTRHMIKVAGDCGLVVKVVRYGEAE